MCDLINMKRDDIILNLKLLTPDVENMMLVMPGFSFLSL